MSSLNGSIANLFVTRKSLVTRNSGFAFSVPLPAVEDRIGWTGKQIKSRRWKGAGSGSNEIFWPRSAARKSRDYFCPFA
jgi:hypothetical protein